MVMLKPLVIAAAVLFGTAEAGIFGTRPRFNVNQVDRKLIAKMAAKYQSNPFTFINAFMHGNFNGPKKGFSWGYPQPATTRTRCANGVTVQNGACCALFPVMADIQANLLDGGICNEGAAESLRLSFHDAIGFSHSMGAAGGAGADGSLIVFSDIETNYDANGGIDDIVERQKPFIAKYNMTPGDFIQFAAAVGVSNCPGAPRLKYMMGRPAPTAPAPDGLVPEPFDSVTTILARFADAGFSPSEVVALMTSHTIGGSAHVDTSVGFTAFDSTPTTFDTQFFVETMLRGTMLPGQAQNHGQSLSPILDEIRLQSDNDLARDSRTACQWQMMLNQNTAMQAFRDAMAKLAVLGQDTSNMVDCSDVIPQPPPLASQPHYPAGLSYVNVEQVCKMLPFPKLTTSVN